jgi:7-carboxy-7-deazaguanine synthase
LSKTRTIRLSEIYGPVIQGEGPVAGLPTVFVRTGGCDFRCAWCDSMHAVDPAHRDQWKPWKPDELAAEVGKLMPRGLVTFSGGNPCAQDCHDHVKHLQDRGYQICVETQGSIDATWVWQCQWLVVSPKPPSSGMDQDIDPAVQMIRRHNGHTAALKYVIQDQLDLEWAARITDQFQERLGFAPPVWVQPVTPLWGLKGNIRQAVLDDRLPWLQQAVFQHGLYHWRVMPQLHAIQHGQERGT